jgi:hypothetical protein
MAPVCGVTSSNAHEAIGTAQIRWPGGDLPEDACFQYVEGEYLKGEEYDEFLDDPDRFTLTRIFPRIAKNLAFDQVPLPPLFWLSNTFFLERLGGSLVSAAPTRRALESLLKLADAIDTQKKAARNHVAEMRSLGFPVVSLSLTGTAYDIVSDYLRGLRGSTLDMYRNPESLLALMDLLEESLIAIPVQQSRESGNPRVFIPLHRGAAGFMGEDQFKTFYWPSFKRLIDGLVAAGLTPIPWFEGDYTPRLKYLAELPPGKVAGHFDKVDRRKFKEILGDSMCFWGNVPSSLLCAGTPRQVKDDVKELIDLFGDTGALMIDCSISVPDQAKPENMYALREAVDEYGVL